jgi:hypothetical protein
MIVRVSLMILQLLFLLQIIKHKEGAEILELLWHAYVSKLVKSGFRINCNYMRNYHLNCALCHSVVIDCVYHDRN